jgi:hypothetical protein
LICASSWLPQAAWQSLQRSKPLSLGSARRTYGAPFSFRRRIYRFSGAKPTRSRVPLDT